MGILITLSPPGLLQLWGAGGGANICFKLTNMMENKQTCTYVASYVMVVATCRVRGWVWGTED